MKETLSHDQLEQLLPAAALEILEGDELLDVSAHLRECAGCAQLLEAYREAAASLATALPEQPFTSIRSARIRARLLARVAGATPQGADPARGTTGWVGRWGGWALAAGMAGVLVVHHAVHRPVAYGWLVAGLLMLLLVGLGVYTRVQQARIAALEKQLRRHDERLR